MTSASVIGILDGGRAGQPIRDLRAHRLPDWVQHARTDLRAGVAPEDTALKEVLALHRLEHFADADLARCPGELVSAL